MTLKVYYDMLSQPSRALLIFLKVNNIPFEPKVVALSKGEQFTEAFSKINPFQKVPVIDHDGFILTESIAIIRYLSREYKIADNWYPKDSKKQAQVDEYLEWQHLNTRLFAMKLFQERIYKPLTMQEPVIEEEIKLYKDDFEKVLKDIKKGFIKNKNYLSGDTITVADIFCACEIEQALAAGFESFSEVPKVKAWLERVKQELDPHYGEVHGDIRNLSSSVLGGKM